MLVIKLQYLQMTMIRNDLTKHEREKELKEEAKRKEDEETEEFIYRVRVPPWNRKIVRLVKQND